MKVRRSNSISAASHWQFSVAWLPAFLLGLSIGIMIHFLPGMREILEEARQPAPRVSQTPAADTAPARGPLWQPPPTAQRRPGR